MVGPRTRSRIRASSIAGNYKTYLASSGALMSTTLGHTGTSESETTSDTTMARPYNVDHALTITHPTVEVGRVNGSRVSGFYRYEFNGYNPTNLSNVAYCPTANPVNTTELVTKALARMNPSRPTVDLPVFIFELKDFPRMLRHLGQVLSGHIKASDIAGGYIAWSFGWAPLISDVSKLIKLTKLIDDRMRWLSRLEAGGKISKSLGKNDFPDSIVGSQALSIAGLTWDVKRTESHKSWASAKSTLLGPLPTGFDDRRWLAARAALGLNISAASLWEALPWSWLIDYLSNVGDILDAGRGFIPHKVTNMCVMTTKTVQLIPANVHSTDGCSLTGGILKTVSKHRTVVANPTVGISFSPVLTWHQTGILTSLVTSSALRKIGR